jgi:DNA-binding response OmpR family regulator
VRHALEHAGYGVLLAHSGHDALRAVHAAPPDLVLLDTTLPDMSGPDALARLRVVPELPVVVLSASTKDADIRASFGLGASDYVVKPCNTDALLARIRAILRGTRRRSAHAREP